MSWYPLDEEVESALSELKAWKNGTAEHTCSRSLDGSWRPTVPRVIRWPRIRKETLETTLDNFTALRIAADLYWRPKSSFPLDLFLEEIAPLLRPVDLLQVSRTNKILRVALLSRSNRRLWSAALTRIPDLPPCPDDISEPCYTALIFDSYCFHCGADQAYSVDYFLRVRLCSTCYSISVQEGHYCIDSYLLSHGISHPKDRDIIEGVANTLWMTLPCASTVPLRMSELTNINEPILRIYPTTHTNEDHYYKPDVEALLQWLLSMPSGEAEACSILLRQRAIEMLRRHKHAIFLELWEKLVLTKYDPIFISLRTALCRALVHFSGLHEDTTISLVLEGAIQSKGPHGVWIVSPLVELDIKHTGVILAEVQERHRREEEAFECRLNRRVAALNDRYDKYLSERRKTSSGDRCRPSLPPTPYDRTAFFRKIMRETDARDRNIEWRLSDMTRYFWVLEVTFKLELAIANSDPEVGTQLKNDYMYERDTRFLNETIQMPDMLFVCSGCGMGRGCQHPPMPWPDIYIHRTTAHGDVSAFEDKACLNPRASVWKPVAGPDGLVNRVLKAVGLDKEETTVKGLNLLVSSGKLHCACGTLEEHHSWAGLMYHFARHGQQGKDAQGNDQLGISTIHAPRRSLANSQVS